MVGKTGRLIGAKLGACRRCMQLSLLAAGLSWVAMLVTWNVFVVIAAVLFTALTLAHYVAFGIRKLELAGDEHGAPTDGCVECSSRRGFIGLVVRAIPLALLAQYVSAAPAAAQADSPCRFDVQRKRCVGTCEAFDQNGEPKGRGECRQVEGAKKCCCLFVFFDESCRRQPGAKECGGDCPPIFLSKEDAATGANPIKGRCVRFFIPKIVNTCICVYRSC